MKPPAGEPFLLRSGSAVNLGFSNPGARRCCKLQLRVQATSWPLSYVRLLSAQNPIPTKAGSACKNANRIAVDRNGWPVQP